ncbi:MAG: carboxypeptidase regulatory-like domain-containing protein [Acidobacteria bacterium]|nr:carboxypeptidase regulatory-like domain-containing protein [Acidobacteriota bacterium]
MRCIRSAIRSLTVAALFQPAMWAAVDGVVINKTSGKPQPNATVTIYKLGEAGMESIETVKSDAQGKFSIEYSPPGGPHLIQAAYDGVTYNKMLPPGTPASGVAVDVFNAQSKPGDAKITQHMLLLEPAEGKLIISENIIYQNTGNLTYNDPAGGTLKFYLPPEANGKAKVSVTAPNGMPVERAASARAGNVYSVDFPIKPGETRFQLNYEVPLPDPPVYRGRILHKEGLTRLVSPPGVSLKGEGLEELGREPQTQAAIYNVTKQDFRIEIEGSGSLRSSSSEQEGPSIQQILPRVYDRLYLVLGLAALILLLGFVLLYRGGAAPRPAGPQPAAAGRKRRA